MIKQHSSIGREGGSFIAIFLGLALMLGNTFAHSSTEPDAHTAPPDQHEVMPPPSDQGDKHNHLEPRYVCPMHPEVVENEPGSCPICGMFLVEAKAEDSNGTRKAMDMPSQAKPMESHDHQHPSSMLPDIKPASESIPMDMQDAPEEHATKHQDPTYVCPMHPEVVQNKPGSCPICGMFLVETEAEDSTGTHKTMPMPSQAKPMESHDHQHPSSMLPDIKPASEPMPMDMHDTPEEHAKKHQDPTYICPMHPQIVQDHPGSCPICGMDLVAKTMDQGTAEHQHENSTTFICPMHPQIMQHEPGNCPICGMDLVSKEHTAPAGGHPQVFLSGAVIQNMGVRTTQVKSGILDTRTKTQGIVAPDDERIIYMHPRAAGWIETLYVRTEGEEVERKDTLADFYSPYITQVQLDFLQALEEQDLAAFSSEDKTDINNKVNALRNSLRLLNVMDMEIKRIENSRTTLATIPIMAPHSGDLTDLGVREGMYVEPFNRMFTIVDLSHVWVMIDLHEHQAAWIKPGMQMEIEAPAVPGRKWTGKVDYIYPVVNPKTRTLRARIEIPNPDEALLLNMFVDVSLLESAKQNVLTVPREAVILSGEREIVIKALGKGHFQPVEVTSGIWSNGKAEILSGLEVGDEVVVSGQFLIDSESSLQASFLRMSE